EARCHFRQAWVDIQERLALAVDRQLDLLAVRRSSEQKSVGVAVQVHPKDVIPVRREGVHDRKTAARADWRAVHRTKLRGSLRYSIVRFAGLRLGITNRERGDSAGRSQVTLHERGRERLRVRDVVEAGTD